MFWSSRDLFVSLMQVKSNNFKTGEIVKAKSHFLKENYPELAVEVQRVNKCSNVNFDRATALKLTKKLQISSHWVENAHIGGRYFIKSNDPYVDTLNIAKDIQSKNNNVEVETFYLNAMMEKLPYDEEVTIYSIPFSKSDEDIVAGTVVYFERLKRMAENGKNMVVVVNELTQLAKSYNNIYLKNSNYSEISNVTNYRVKSIVATAKNIGVGSITLICVDALKVPTNIANLFEYEILPLFL